MTITLKRQGTCAQCGATLAAGTRAKWYRNGAVYGLDCHARVEGSLPRFTARVSWKETESKLRHIEWRRNGLAFTHAHSGDPEKEKAYQEGLRKLDAESDAVWDAYYKSHPEKDRRPKSQPAAEDYPCSDAGYEDQCARACGL